MTEIERIEDQLRRSIEGDAWHGPALNELLKDVTAEEAAAKPIPHAHSIWEILLHVITDQELVLERLPESPRVIPESRIGRQCATKAAPLGQPRSDC